MIIAVAVTAMREMLKAMIIELPQKAGVAAVPKVFLENSSLFKSLWDQNLEAPSMWRPGDPPRVCLLGENVMNLLRE